MHSNQQSPCADPLEVYRPGQDAHCRRVAAWSLEIAANLHLPETDRKLVGQAALLHHYPREVLYGALDRLLDETHITVAPRRPGDLPPTGVLRVLELLDSQHTQERHFRRLANLVEAGNYFDEQIELASLDGQGFDQVFSEASNGRLDDLFDPEVIQAMLSIRCARREDLLAVIPNLPVYRTVAMEAMALLASPQPDAHSFELLAEKDQVLAGALVSAANSSYFSRGQSVTTVRRALSHLGFEIARQIVSSIALRPVFISPKSRALAGNLWQHSLESAQLCEQIARLTRHVDPQEAFLAGLVHDVGRLVVSLLPAATVDAHERLMRSGCEPLVCESILLGMDHAEIGAEVLTLWKFPPHQIDAIRYHHQPERSGSNMASILYISEFWTASEEDLPSQARMDYSLSHLGISIDTLKSSSLLPRNGLQALLA